MVVTVGGMEEARALMKKLKMPDVEWMKPGRVQRSWDANVPNSPLLELAAICCGGGRQVGHVYYSSKHGPRREVAV
jgi:hypothetical protein